MSDYSTSTTTCTPKHGDTKMLDVAVQLVAVSDVPFKDGGCQPSFEDRDALQKPLEGATIVWEQGIPFELIEALDRPLPSSVTESDREFRLKCKPRKVTSGEMFRACEASTFDMSGKGKGSPAFFENNMVPLEEARSQCQEGSVIDQMPQWREFLESQLRIDAYMQARNSDNLPQYDAIASKYIKAYFAKLSGRMSPLETVQEDDETSTTSSSVPSLETRSDELDFERDDEDDWSSFSDSGYGPSTAGSMPDLISRVPTPEA